MKFILNSSNKFIFLLFITNICYGQIVKGYVYDGVTKKPLSSVALYFNNTTIGTITNDNGYFEIKEPDIHTELVVRYLGYSDKIISNIKKDNLLNIYMIEESDELDEVVVEYKDPLPRELRLSMFRRGFLGDVRNKKCKILNENDLSLRYNMRKKTLLAKSKKPILVENKTLGYKLEFSLIDYLSEYKSFGSKKISYYGTTKFESISDKRKIIKNREKAYLGSILHFMRSIYKKTLKDNKFGAVNNGTVVDLDTFIKVKIDKNKAYIQVIKDTLDIIYYKNNAKRQSKMIVTDKKFIIDKFGNHYSDPKIIFSGDMGMQKTCDMLPLDYKK